MKRDMPQEKNKKQLSTEHSAVDSLSAELLSWNDLFENTQRLLADHSQANDLRQLLQQLWQLTKKGVLPHRRLQSWRYAAATPYWKEWLAAKPAVAAADDFFDVRFRALSEMASADETSPSRVDGIKVLSFQQAFADKKTSSILLSQLTKLAQKALKDLQQSKAQQLKSIDPMHLLTLTCWQQGVFIYFEKGVLSETLCHLRLRHQSPGLMSRLLCVSCAAGLNIKLLIEHEDVLQSQSTSYHSLLTAIDVAEKTDVDFYYLQNTTDKLHLCHHAIAEVEKDASLNVTTALYGGQFARENWHVFLNGAHASAKLLGVSQSLFAKQYQEYQSCIDHQVEETTAEQLFRGVLTQPSTSVFRGLVKVRSGAQKTNSSQNNAYLLLSDHAKVVTEPCLNISADDVRCAHGATIGALDEHALFYLRSRGIEADVARDMLKQAFLQQVLAECQLQSIADDLQSSFNRAFLKIKALEVCAENTEEEVVDGIS